MDSNYETALKAEMKKVIRCFHRHDTDAIAILRSRRGRPCQEALDGGVFFYSHPSVPGIAFRTRSQAAEYAMNNNP
jgi:hypothetical protein